MPILLIVGDRDATGLDDFLKPFDIALGKGFVFEPRLNYPRDRGTIFVPVVNPKHPIIEPLANHPVLFPRPAPLKLISQTSPGQQIVTVLPTVLLKTSRESWVERPVRNGPTDL